MIFTKSLKRGRTVEDHVEEFERLVNRFVGFAKGRNDVRAAMIVGSRARKDTPADEWSDLDIVFAADDPGIYIDSSEWLQTIGDFSITFIEETAVGGGRERRVLFEGEMDVDFAIFDTGHFKKLLSSPEARGVFERGVRVLFDKDGILKTADGSEEDVPEIRSGILSESEFMNLVNDFWYHAVWSSKKLLRGELWTAKSCVDGYMKRILLRFIEWHAKAKNGPDYDTWHGGRFFERWADGRFVEKMKGCFSHYDKDDVKRALANTMELFDLVASETAELYGYRYPRAISERTAGWVKRNIVAG